MNKDLRSFLEKIKKLGPDHFVTVSKELDTKYEPCVIQQKLAHEKKFPVIYCERMKGSKLPLITNLFGSYELLGLALGIDPGKPKSDILKVFREKFERPVPVKEIPKAKAPVKEIVLKGKDADLGVLPIVHHAEKDSAKYITPGCLISKDPDTGKINVGMYRHELQGKNLLGSMFNPAHHGAYIYRRYKELNKPMEAVIFLGHHPAVVMGALVRSQVSEMEVMGSFLGEPLEVTRAETVDIPVPACAEIAIEGVLYPDKETGDGPFAEYTGYYGPAKRPVPLFQVKAITMRKNAIFHDLDPAHREHVVSGVLAYESSVYETVQKLVPSVQGVHMPPSGVCVLSAYVAIKKRVAGEGKSAGLAALSAEPNLKMIVVVDDDIDIYNEEQVIWAIVTRMEADIGLTMIPHILGAHLDPSAYGEVRTEKGPMQTKLILDATRPVSLPFAERIFPPKDAWNRMRLEDYVNKR
ncbi:MAG TPA: UbiD family decarboxylase [Syntrophorhabdales bacterium]|nr:UbiD family decarboxylase [Syntrophorhabdales bacterium]